MLLLKGKCRIVSRTVTLHINLSLVDRSCLYSFVCLFRFVFFKHYFQARGRLKKNKIWKKIKLFSETILYKGGNLSHEKVVEYLTISKVVNLFTTILEFPKKTTLTKQINTL